MIKSVAGSVNKPQWYVIGQDKKPVGNKNYKTSAEAWKALYDLVGVSHRGVGFGILRPDGTINVQRMSENPPPNMMNQYRPKK